MNKFTIKPYVVTRLATVLAAVLLGLSGARAVNLWLQANDASPESTGEKTENHVRSKNKAPNYHKLVKLHLLGLVEKKQATAPKKQEIAAPETNLKLKLIGVLFDRESGDGYAIISEAGKPQKTFHKGDKLPGNATLYAVKPDKIILQRNGRHETLTLLKPDLHGKSAKKPPIEPIQAWKKSHNIRNKPLPDDPGGPISKARHTF